MDKAIIEAIMLRKCYLQKLAEHKNRLPDITDNEDTLWGEVYALNWVLNLIGGSENNLQWTFRDMCNALYDIGKESSNGKRNSK